MSGGNEVRKLHRLDPKIVANDEKLALVIDEYLQDDKTDLRRAGKANGGRATLDRRYRVTGVTETLPL